MDVTEGFAVAREGGSDRRTLDLEASGDVLDPVGEAVGDSDVTVAGLADVFSGDGVLKVFADAGNVLGLGFGHEQGKLLLHDPSIGFDTESLMGTVINIYGDDCIPPNHTDRPIPMIHIRTHSWGGVIRAHPCRAGFGVNVPDKNPSIGPTLHEMEGFDLAGTGVGDVDIDHLLGGSIGILIKIPHPY